MRELALSRRRTAERMVQGERGGEMRPNCYCGAASFGDTVTIHSCPTKTFLTCRQTKNIFSLRQQTFLVEQRQRTQQIAGKSLQTDPATKMILEERVSAGECRRKSQVLHPTESCRASLQVAVEQIYKQSRWRAMLEDDCTGRYYRFCKSNHAEKKQQRNKHPRRRVRLVRQNRRYPFVP